MALGPRCFRCCMFMLSGPSDLLLCECFSACMVCSLVRVIDVGVSFFYLFLDFSVVSVGFVRDSVYELFVKFICFCEVCGGVFVVENE